MPDDFLHQVTDRYIELYEKVTGKAFQRGNIDNIEDRIRENVEAELRKLAN